MPTSDTVEALLLDLLEWIGPGPRPYDEVLEAWRTSCPRLPVWEEATARGFIDAARGPDGGRLMTVSAAGRAHLRAHRTAQSDATTSRSPASYSSSSRSAP